MQLNEVIKNRHIIIKVTDYDEDGKKYDMWTATDGHGHFLLTGGGDIWFTDNPNNELLHEPVEPVKPRNNSLEYAVLEINGRFGVYNTNTLEKYADAHDVHDAWDKLHNMEDEDARDRADDEEYYNNHPSLTAAERNR